MRRLFAIAVLGVLLQPAQAQNAPTTIRVAVLDMAVTIFCANFSMIRNPQFTRFAKEENLAFEPVQVESSLLPTVVSDGDLPVGECSGLSTIFNAWSKGARNLAVFSVGSVKPVYQIISSKQFNTLADLRGKSLGTPGLQTASTEAIQVILKRGAGLNYPGDYELISTGTGSARIAALMSGRIDALPTFPPYSYDLIDRGYKLLGDEADYLPQYVTGPYVVNRDWAAKNPDVLRRLIRALVKTGLWMQDPANKNEVIDWFAQNVDLGGGKKLGKNFATRLYADMITNPRVSFTGYAPEAAVRTNIDVLVERNVIARSDVAPLDRLFDWSWLNNVLAELHQPQVALYQR